MKLTAKHLGAIGIVTATTAIMSAGGVAGASASQDYGSYGSYGGYGQHAGYDDKSYDDRGYGHRYDDNDGNYENDDWNNYEPSKYKQHHGGDSNQWYDNAMGSVGDYEDDEWNQGGEYGDRNWTPSGDNWQNDWNNWNPQMWKDHGSSYENWRDKVVEFMSYNRTTLTIQFEQESFTSFSSRDSERERAEQY